MGAGISSFAVVSIALSTVSAATQNQLRSEALVATNAVQGFASALSDINLKLATPNLDQAALDSLEAQLQAVQKTFL